MWGPRSIIVWTLLAVASASAQVDLPVFGKQNVVNGYAKDIEGEVLSYFSVYPEHATTALLTRCTDGKKAIAWETANVPFYPQDENIPYYYFSWIAAHNSTTSGGDRSFDLFINDQLALTFTTHHNTKPGSWSAAAADSTKLVFEFNKMDRHGDAHGFAHLRVPRKYITLGKPLRLKVVGHAQDSPDWFMTFRYTFEEKVEVEVLPFLLKDGSRPVQFTVMHFGSPTKLQTSLFVGGWDDPEWPQFEVTQGLHVFQAAYACKNKEHGLVISGHFGDEGHLLSFDTALVVQPVTLRHIYLVHHSHNDIGYSHLQPEVEKIQNNNIYKALDLIDRTKDYPPDSRFVWNIESLWAVENFLGIASEADKQRFITAVKSGGIALSANYANILTGLCTPEEMHWIVEYADSLRKWYGLPITMAMQTDIPGMSWSMVDAYAAHGIRYLSQGPNYIPDLPDGGDRIGSTLREQGDKPYWWKGTTGRDSILVWTAGQGYGGWHGFTPGAIKERGTRKIAAYMNELAAKGYPYEMVQWRYNIVSDNGPVDSTLSDFVRDWNEKYSSPHLIIANAGEMMQKFETMYGKSIPTWSGDFTPYWEDGAYSTAKEEGDVRVLSARLSNLIDAAKILNKPIDPHLLYRAKRSLVMWHEHTWGSWNSISEPDAPFTTEQWRYKKAFADSAAWYVGELSRNISTSMRGGDTVLVVNTLPWQRTGRFILEPPTMRQPDYFIVNDSNEVMPTQILLGDYQLVEVRAMPERSHTILSFGKRDKRRRMYTNPYERLVQGNSAAIRKLLWKGCDLVDTTKHHGLLNFLYVNGIDPMVQSESRLDNFSIQDDGPLTRVHQIVFKVDSSMCGWNHFERTPNSGFVHSNIHFFKYSVHTKESMHLALPFNIPNATVRIGISDTCVTPESGRIPGSNNDFFCAQRWIDVSNDSMGVTIVCPQGAIWEVGEMVDERKVVPGRGTNPELYKAWKTGTHSSSTLYLYALNNYWHTNFKADQEGPITFDLYLKMHGPFKLEEARRFGLEMTRPLITWWK